MPPTPIGREVVQAAMLAAELEEAGLTAPPPAAAATPPRALPPRPVPTPAGSPRPSGLPRRLGWAVAIVVAPVAFLWLGQHRAATAEADRLTERVTRLELELRAARAASATGTAASAE